MIKSTPVRTRASRAEKLANPLEDRLVLLQEQFAQLKAQVRQAQQLSTLGTAAATMAHEFNNLLTPVLAYADYAVTTDDMELHKKALRRTAKNVRVLIAMSERILRLGSAKTAKIETVNVGDVVKEAMESLCRDPRKDGVTVQLAVPESLTAQCDPLQLHQVLFNLLLNAGEAMAKHHGGYLKVTAHRTDDTVVLELQNTGDPIPADVLPAIFETFSTSKPVVRDGKERAGGLGLALCRDLMQENHGTISVASSQEDGTTFTLTLPTTRES